MLCFALIWFRTYIAQFSRVIKFASELFALFIWLKSYFECQDIIVKINRWKIDNFSIFFHSKLIERAIPNIDRHISCYFWNWIFVFFIYVKIELKLIFFPFLNKKSVMALSTDKIDKKKIMLVLLALKSYLLLYVNRMETFNFSFNLLFFFFFLLRFFHILNEHFCLKRFIWIESHFCQYPTRAKFIIKMNKVI